MPQVLPDSRLNSTIGDIVADWPVNGQTIRLTLQPIFCINCGKPQGYVPRDVISFVSWMCQPCSEKYGVTAAQSQSSDRAFWDKVHEEMLSRFGRALTEQELDRLAAQGKLGRNLELLDRESPYT